MHRRDFALELISSFLAVTWNFNMKIAFREHRSGLWTEQPQWAWRMRREYLESSIGEREVSITGLLRGTVRERHVVRRRRILWTPRSDRERWRFYPGKIYRSEKSSSVGKPKGCCCRFCTRDEPRRRRSERRRHARTTRTAGDLRHVGNTLWRFSIFFRSLSLPLFLSFLYYLFLPLSLSP